ncbi:MerR family transcriptional regulator [Microlunatus capsulatus]|uniref:DNA-binding transcriptional MerR regulator n=1 Tax=Microlunatus capsulatus TaxID=99117 RepID=A0ABS4Z530_9ACTN|nr:MerR family transcriptional regulator [Microlunatus capsulatus]MBP2416069.1 DNA-binding transcriptional MerR regulator [Microlunatus capsulatus]
MPGADAGAGAPQQIGRVAEDLGLSIRTLRHWDEVGLVPPSVRSAGGYRLYTADDVDRLRTIRRMKPLGFTLEEMGRLLASLDVLDGAGASEEDTRAAAAFVADCHARAEESCATLARQLGWAEEFRDLLAGRG